MPSQSVTNIRPIIKWAGGKRQLLPELLERIPAEFNTYIEPFLGGGAVFLGLRPNKSMLNDVNPDLINIYRVIQKQPYALIEDLRKHKNEKSYFYKIRNQDRNPLFEQLDDVQKASRTIFLNKTCFNGLYRLNSRGEFNTPFGYYKNPNIVNEGLILDLHEVFNTQDVRLLNKDFGFLEDLAQAGDFVYLDPPYHPLSSTANFTSYSASKFQTQDQERLKQICDLLDQRGVHFMQSNSAAPFIEHLYKEYSIDYVKARRSINSKGNKRGAIKEVIIRNYG